MANVEEENNVDEIKNNYSFSEEKKIKSNCDKIIKRTLLIILTIMTISITLLYIKGSFSTYKTDVLNYDLLKPKSSKIYSDNSEEILHIPSKYKISQRPNITNRLIKHISNNDYKVGLCFIFTSIFANGIGRMLSILFDELVKYDKYDIYLISKGAYSLDFKFNNSVKHLNIYGNRTAIKEFDKKANIKYYILNNELSPELVKWYKSLGEGKKVIDIMHGVYLSAVYSNDTGVYKYWFNHNYFDAFVQVTVDDYYIYKNLGLNNTFYIPNMFTFNPSTTPNSNLTYKNLMIMGRENDGIKGGIYAIKAMSIIVKEVPDSFLYFISSDYRIQFIRDAIKELNLTNNVQILHFVSNISHYFLNSSILLCPSKSESFPMVMNEGKAHGLPIVAFNVSYSPSYQKGVILVDMLNYTQMAKEAIKLLNDYEYRKKKGMEAKLSLNEYSNKETTNKWDRLFSILDKDDPVAYKKLQNYTYERYYDEDKARERLESNYNFGRKHNKYFCCHTFNDMNNMTYLQNIKGCKNQSECKY